MSKRKVIKTKDCRGKVAERPANPSAHHVAQRRYSPDDRVGEWTIIHYAGRIVGTATTVVYLCLCRRCNKRYLVGTGNLSNGVTQSCRDCAGPRARERINAAREVTDRVCLWCGVDYTATYEKQRRDWQEGRRAGLGAKAAECSACARRACRNGRSPCGLPKRQMKPYGRPDTHSCEECAPTGGGGEE